MNLMVCLAAFFSGVFACNSIPHLVSGLRGESFQTPFAKPPGVGLSSALVNFLWGSGNLFVAILLLACQPPPPGFSLPLFVFFFGFLLSGLLLSLHFQKVRSGR